MKIFILGAVCTIVAWVIIHFALWWFLAGMVVGAIITFVAMMLAIDPWPIRW